MEKLGKFIVRRKILILVIYLLLLIPSIIGMLGTKTNYDLLKYVPDNLNSKKGQVILNENFGMSDTIYLVVHNKENWEVKNLKENILKIKGVKSIDWLDDYSDLMVPSSFISKDIKENFVAGNSTILQVHLNKNANNGSDVPTINEIKKLANSDSYIGGQPAMLHEFQTIIDKEIKIYMGIALAVILLILSLATTSIIEPFLMLLSIGTAIMLNMGTNYFLGEISYITGSVVAIMQLAVSMDYSIFLIHRYHEEKQLQPTKEIAMVESVKKAASAVSGSALTTIAGFAALMIMKMGIGKDLGFILAKGVVLSLITSLTLLPSLVVLFDKVIEKTKHRTFLPRFNLISRWILKFKWVFLILIIIIALPSYFAQKNLTYYYSNEKQLPESAKSIIDNNKIKEEFNTGNIAYLILSDNNRTKESALIKEIKSIENIKKVSGLSESVDDSIPDSFIPEEIKSKFQSNGYSNVMIQLGTEIDDPKTMDLIAKIKETSAKYYKEFYLTGETVLNNDVKSISAKDFRNVSLLSIGLVALIIAASFRSFSLPAILILIIQSGIWFNMAIPYFSGTSVSFLTPMFVGSIQLGATIDYAILFTSRYKENRQTFSKNVEAIQQTIKDTGKSIFTSAVILFAATFVIALFSSIKTTKEFTMLIGRGAIISMVISLIGLPVMFLIFDRFIGWTTLGWKRKQNLLQNTEPQVQQIPQKEQSRPKQIQPEQSQFKNNKKLKL
ncbi:MAG: MMPL family transporter [Actinomycetota bacterium]|nr:MMPL family transporter [Actinomycetota bacterium]